VSLAPTYLTSLGAVLGAALVLVIVWDAFETILVPRRIGRRVRLTRYFYVVTWRIWRALAVRQRTTSRREGLLGFYGPISLLLLLLCWASGLIFAFALLELTFSRSAGHVSQTFGMTLYASGQTFFTLGYGDYTPTSPLGRMLAVLESGLGFGFLGTVVGYLPTMYAAFSQREIEISLMDARAGSPPTAAEFLRRTPPLTGGRCDEILAAWERWAAQLLETHISYPQLAYYRSQHSNQSWLAALVTILDSTAVLLARPGAARGSQAGQTFAMARHALVDITQIFVREYTPLPGERPIEGGPRALMALRTEPALSPEAERAFEHRLAELRLLYEPYARALGAFLLFELPPWQHVQPRQDNWERAPWDKLIAARRDVIESTEDHF
jgi:hypothetical protein